MTIDDSQDVIRHSAEGAKLMSEAGLAGVKLHAAL